MHYLACDVSKNFIDAALCTRGLTVKQRWHQPNQPEKWCSIIADLANKFRLTVGVESTGLYHRMIVEVCDQLSVPCRLINPILTKEVLRHSIRGRKTDRDDAVVIAKLLVQGEGHLVTRVDIDNQTKWLARSAHTVNHFRQALNLHQRHLQQLVSDLPPALPDTEDRLKTCVSELRLAAQRTCEHTPEWLLLRSLPGIADWLATLLVAELGTPYRFTSGDSLVALAGLDGKVRQSGQSNWSGKMTKRGSPQLRWALTCAANVARRHDPELKEFYERKRNEGKPYRVALCATAKKLAYRLHAVLKRGKPYQIKKVIVEK